MYINSCADERYINQNVHFLKLLNERAAKRCCRYLIRTEENRIARSKKISDCISSLIFYFVDVVFANYSTGYSVSGQFLRRLHWIWHHSVVNLPPNWWIFFVISHLQKPSISLSFRPSLTPSLTQTFCGFSSKNERCPTWPTNFSPIYR